MAETLKFIKTLTPKDIYGVSEDVIRNAVDKLGYEVIDFRIPSTKVDEFVLTGIWNWNSPDASVTIGNVCSTGGSPRIIVRKKKAITLKEFVVGINACDMKHKGYVVEVANTANGRWVGIICYTGKANLVDISDGNWIVTPERFETVTVLRSWKNLKEYFSDKNK